MPLVSTLPWKICNKADLGQQIKYNEFITTTRDQEPSGKDSSRKGYPLYAADHAGDRKPEHRGVDRATQQVEFMVMERQRLRARTLVNATPVLVPSQEWMLAY
jgi:hypothetical protein